MKIASIVGARPQFIKAAAVSRVLREQAQAEEILIHTGQHYDKNMSDVFFTELDIPEPAINLGIGSGNHGEQTARMLDAIERVLLERKPDAVLIYGDTNSTLAGALAAAKLHIPVAHVEAGLRSFNRRMPEEINRVVADHCADLLLAPTQAGVENLRNEGIVADKIKLVGDVMYDAALFYSVNAERTSGILRQLDLRPKSYVLCTVHRAENTDDPIKLRAIFDALAATASAHTVVLPLHPRTRAAVARLGLNIAKGLRIIDPVGYLDMVLLEKNARLIATDSGGVQKEAYFHRVPCVTLRDETEWVELVSAGWNTLIPPGDSATIAAGIERGLQQQNDARPHPDFYGTGHAARLIVDALQSSYGTRLRSASDTP